MNIDRSSIRNSFKYFLTSGIDELSGVPKLTNKIPFLLITIVSTFVKSQKEISSEK